MSAATLKPGRYELRGGPRGEYALRHMDDLRRDASGRRVYTAEVRGYTARWHLLASLRVRPGHEVTFYGVIGAAQRVWTLA